jgi:hypothetical protein
VKIDVEKTEFNRQAKASMRNFLRSKSWVEKVRAIEQMNEASRKAKEAMRRTDAQQADNNASDPH